MCTMKDYGGLATPNVRDLNICLFGSWIKRYIDVKNRVWKSLVGRKYQIESPNIFYSREVGTSYFWKGVLWASKAVKFG